MKIFMVITLLSFLLSVCPLSAQAAEDTSPVVAPSKKTRPYPGGVDEEDLKVQENMKAPTTSVDRKGIEARVLKSYFKKIEEETDSNKKSE